MTIEIHNPEIQDLIRRGMKDGGFQNAEEVVMEALLHRGKSAAPITRRRPEGRQSLAELFADSPFKGLDIDFEREPDYGRDVDL